MTKHLKKWFWKWEWGPEPNRYLRELWPTLDGGQRSNLLSSILEGPEEQVKDDDWVDRRIYGMLKTIESVSDDTDVKKHLNNLERQFSYLKDWQIEGFSTWRSSMPAAIEQTELTEDELIDGLRKPKDNGIPSHLQPDLTREYLSRLPGNATDLLDRLEVENLLSDQPLAEVLNELPESTLNVTFVCKIVAALPSGEHPRVAFALARILRFHAKEKNTQDFELLWPVAYDECSRIQFAISDHYEDAINHPLGRVADALFDYLSTLKLKANTEFPRFPHDALLSLISKSPGQCAAVSEIASRIAFLHAVEPEFAKSFLWIFDWKNTEARLAWESFLFHPRWHRSLFLALDNDFRQTIGNTKEFDRHRQEMLGGLLAQVSAIEGLISPADTAILLRSDNLNVLQGIAERLANHVKSTDSRLRDNLWTNTLKPWFQETWPATEATGGSAWAHEQISKALAEICSHLNATFGDAVEMFGDRIGRVPHLYLYIAKPLLEGGKAEQFPKELASLLERLTRGGIHRPVPAGLSELLAKLKSVTPNSPNVKKLSDRLVAVSA